MTTPNTSKNVEQRELSFIETRNAKYGMFLSLPLFPVLSKIDKNLFLILRMVSETKTNKHFLKMQEPFSNLLLREHIK